MNDDTSRGRDIFNNNKQHIHHHYGWPTRRPIKRLERDCLDLTCLDLLIAYYAAAVPAVCVLNILARRQQESPPVRMHVKPDQSQKLQKTEQ